MDSKHQAAMIWQVQMWIKLWQLLTFIFLSVVTIFGVNILGTYTFSPLISLLSKAASLIIALGCMLWAWQQRNMAVAELARLQK